MNQDIREIESISFGVYSEDEYRKMSACTLISSKRSGIGTVYDPRMGTTESKKICETCDEPPQVCPGHFGLIELNEPIIHPLYF